jgi:putative membrane protein
MRLIFRLVALVLFIIFFDFALKNTDEVVLHFFWGSQARSPIILLLLAFFVVGVAMGVLAMTGTVLRYRRELSRLKKEVEHKKSNTDSAARLREQPSPPASIIEQVGL